MLADASNPAFSKFAAITQLPNKARGAGSPAAHHATATSSVNQPIAPPAPLAGGLQRAVTMPATAGRPVAAISVGSQAGGGAESPTASAGSSVGVGTSWAAVFAAPSTPALSPPQRPPGETSSDQEWPSLGGGSGGSGTALAEVPRPAAQTAPVAPPAAQQQTEAALEPRQGDTMAAQLARAYSAPVKPAAGSGRAAAGKKTQAAAAANRGRGAKTLVPPPPPLSSAPVAEGGQVQLLTGSARDAKATAGMQLKRSLSNKVVAVEQPVAAANLPSHAVGTPSSERRAESRSPAHSSADASPSRAALLQAPTSTRATPSAAGDAAYATSVSAAARPRAAGPPPGFAAGPPPGFDRLPGGAAAGPAMGLAAQRAGSQPRALQGGLSEGQSAQLPLASVAPQHIAGLSTAAVMELRNGSGRRESRFSFARSPPVNGGALQCWVYRTSGADHLASA